MLIDQRPRPLVRPQARLHRKWLFVWSPIHNVQIQIKNFSSVIRKPLKTLLLNLHIQLNPRQIRSPRLLS